MLQTKLSYIREYEAKQTHAWRLGNGAYWLLLKALVSLLYPQAGLKRVQREQEKQNRTPRVVGMLGVSMMGGCPAVGGQGSQITCFVPDSWPQQTLSCEQFLFYAESWKHLHRRSPALSDTLAFLLKYEISSYLHFLSQNWLFRCIFVIYLSLPSKYRPVRCLATSRPTDKKYNAGIQFHSPLFRDLSGSM